MKLTVLMDNHTYIDEYYLGEPAVSYYIEEGDIRMLLDCGYSDAFLRNASAMGIDLAKLTHIVFSHGHDDHTRGLQFLREVVDLSKVKIIAHPQAFEPKQDEGLYCGSPFTAEETNVFCHLQLSKAPMAITENLWFLGEIERSFDFESGHAVGEHLLDGQWTADYCYDDTALAYRSDEGLFIITGCSHSGICNIIEQAKRLCGDHRIAGVLGGFHLFDVDDRLMQTIDYLESCNIKDFYPCHCVSLKAKAKMMEKLDVEEVGVGMKLEI